MLLNERGTIKKLFAEGDFMPLNKQDDADTGVMFYYNPWNPSKLQYNFYFILVWVHRFVSKNLLFFKYFWSDWCVFCGFPRTCSQSTFFFVNYLEIATNTCTACISLNPPHIYLFPKAVFAPSWICLSDRHFKKFRLKLHHILFLIPSFFNIVVIILIGLLLSFSWIGNYIISSEIWNK